jgi:hypothetical protein
MLLLALLIACSSEPVAPEPPPIDDAEIARAVAATLCEAAAAAGMACEAQEASLVVAGRGLSVEVSNRTYMTFDPTTIGRGEDAQRIPGEAQLSALVQISVDGQALPHAEPSHSASDVDLAAARAAVLDGFADRYVVTHGSALLDALSGRTESPVLASLGMAVTAADHGELTAWAGYPALRGRGFEPGIADKLGPSVHSMAVALGPFVEGLGTEGLHTVQVKAKLGGGGSPGPCGIIPPLAMSPGATTSIVPFSGQVLVDGRATGDICALSGPVNWPLPPQGAVLEWDQLFIIGPAGSGS